MSPKNRYKDNQKMYYTIKQNLLLETIPEVDDLTKISSRTYFLQTENKNKILLNTFLDPYRTD